MNYKNWSRYGIVMAPDDGAGGGAPATPPAETPATPPPATPEGGTGGGAGAAAGGAAAGGAPAAVSMTREEFDSAIAQASAKALADAKAEQTRLQAEAAAREAEARRIAGARQNPNSQVDAVEALDLRADMLEEALTLHPDMPLEARQQLKEDLRQFKGIEQIRAAREAKLHVKLADAAAGASIRSGKYVPKSVSDSVQQLHREPVHTAPPSAPKVPDAYRQAIKADGLDLSEAELEEAYKIDAAYQRPW